MIATAMDQLDAMWRTAVERGDFRRLTVAELAATGCLLLRSLGVAQDRLPAIPQAWSEAENG